MNRPIVLLVEDETSVVAFIQSALERYGYCVEAAASGAQALEMLRDRSYSGVISDMRTPGGVDGAGVWSWIAGHRPELLRKLIFITGDIVNEETAATLRRTCAPFIEKPFRVHQLISTLEQVLGQRQ